LKIYPTKTGENTLYLPELDETYHSRNGAISEALHVFIKQGYNRMASANLTEINVFEIGFGTGLNALVTAIESNRSKIKTEFTTIEPYPIPSALIEQLNYGSFLNNVDLYSQIHNADWNKKMVITPTFNIIKMLDKLEETTLLPSYFDVIFFDAFAPKKQPELWTADIFNKLYESLKPNGVLTTYSAAGQLKRDLKSVGFTLDHPAGANGKREMTVAIKIV